MLSPNRLKCADWHGTSARPETTERSLLVEILVPLGVAVVFLMIGWKWMAGIVVGLALILLTLRLWAPRVRQRVDACIGAFAEWLGRMVTVILLAVPFFVIMPIIRVWNLLNGKDLLRLKRVEQTSYWMPADTTSRRDRVIGRMFCSERLAVEGGWKLTTLLVALLVLGGFTEVGLRIYGLGRPILFVQDPDVGYYPKPSQTARYPGRVVTINRYGMRAGEIQMPKPSGNIRILMIGDSTLAGTKVSNHELYTAHLEKILNQGTESASFEVLNMGVNAWGPLHEAAFIRKFGTFDADVAVICGPVANCFRPKYGLERLPFSPANSPPKSAIEHVGYEMMWRLREKALGAPMWSFPGSEQDRQAAEGLKGYMELATMFQHAGAEVLMEMLPARAVTLGAGEDPDGARLFTSIQRGMASVGVKAQCAGPIFKDVPNREEIYHDGVHFDYRGHELYAGYLAKQLRQFSKIVREAGNPEMQR